MGCGIVAVVLLTNDLNISRSIILSNITNVSYNKIKGRNLNPENKAL